MADDRMKKDDLQRNMGAGDKEHKHGQQSPGRAGQDTGHKQAGQHSQPSGGQVGGQKGARNMEDDDDDFGGRKSGTQNRGSQNR